MKYIIAGDFQEHADHPKEETSGINFPGSNTPYFSTLRLKCCHSFQYPLEGYKKQEIVGNTFRMFGLGS